nr:DUF1579 family protein [Bradyrhizobium sp. CCH1-B1]
MGGQQSVNAGTLAQFWMKFVGSFIGSMMTHHWLYEGTLDEAANVLTLESSGPNMTGDGAVIPYRDVVTLVSPDHRILASYMPDGKGGWSEFMTAHYRRTA